MREQEERFGLTEKTDSVPVTDYSSNSPDGKIGIGDENKPESSTPPLAIAVTMSEDGEDPVQSLESAAEGVPQFDEQEAVGEMNESSENNVSAWAMMEHYQLSKDERPTKLDDHEFHQDNASQASNEAVPLWDSSLVVEDYSFETSDSEGVRDKEIFVPEKEKWDGYEETSETIMDGFKHNDTTDGLEWHEDENGELVQNSYCTNISEHIRPEVQPTPSRLRREWQNGGGQDDDFSIPTSLLQVSMIQSDDHESVSADAVSKVNCNVDVESIDVPEDGYSNAPSVSQIDNVTQLSVVSLQVSDGGMLERSDQEVAKAMFVLPSGSTLDSTTAQGARLGSSDKETISHLAKIEELEQSLKVQRHVTDKMQSKMKERVEELERALRATTTTPRGTVVQENPINALLDRNQTLVKEVRFADQTCVELSSKVSALEAQNRILNEQMVVLESENVNLRQELDNAQESCESSMSKLGEVQKNLSESSKMLQEERLRSQKLEQLLRNGSTAERPREVEKHVSFVEKELASAKASIVALKCESEMLLSEDTEFEFNPSSPEERKVVVVLRVALAKLREKFHEMDHKVENLAESYMQRLEKLSDTVAYLRSALLFETESDSTQVKEESVQKMDAVIDNHHKSHLQDEILELMEEARSPPSSKLSHLDESSSDFGDFSRLFLDEATLESVARGESIVSSSSGLERWKEPLEAAVKECQRVRERSSQLKNELDSQMIAFEQLKLENERLSLRLSGETEKKVLVEKALEEAKERIKNMQPTLNTADQEGDHANVEGQVNGKNTLLFDEERKQLESDLQRANEQRDVLAGKLDETTRALAEVTDSLSATKRSCEDYRARCDDLQAELKTQEKNIAERMHHEVTLAHKAVLEATQETNQLKESNREITSKLSVELEEKQKLESKIANLQAGQQQLLSETEDRVLDSRYRLEDIRKERAELRTKLSRREKDLASLKELYSNYKGKSQMQLEKNDSIIESLKSEFADITYQTEQLKSGRHTLFQALQSVGMCEELVRNASNAEEDATVHGVSKIVLELSHWSEMVPNLAAFIQNIAQRQSKFEKVDREVQGLKEDLSRSRGLELDYKKQVDDEKNQNEKLFSLLRQAEVEMECSAEQIREMSTALSRLQKQETAATEKGAMFEKNFIQLQKELESLQDQWETERNKIQSSLVETTTALRTSESELTKSKDHL